MRNIGFIVGSLRKGAYTRLLSQAIQEIAQPSFKLTEIGIGELPFYNQDLETETPPAQWVAFRNQVKQSDAILFITPEYNRGIPAVVKNAVDVGSRPPKDSVWNGRPVAVISLTPGKFGAMTSNQQLRHSLACIGSPVLPLPEAYLGDAAGLFDANGKLSNEDTRKFLAKVLASFETWIGRFK